MDVISYRGPGQAGGVSSGLERAWRSQHEAGACWWFFSGEFLNKLPSDYVNSQFVTMFSEKVVQGHYRFCNQFIWPIMHDLPQYAEFNECDQEHYRQFNMKLADHVTYEGGNRFYFVQDYQMALVPRYAKLYGARTHVFWHIPWPKAVLPKYLQPIVEIARALLRADGIGFHTQEYVQNFMRFVWQYLPEFVVDQEEQRVRRIVPVSQMKAKPSRLATTNDGAYVLSRQRPFADTNKGGTVLFARPLGIDAQFWQTLASSCENVTRPEILDEIKTPWILSVDRADYTKSVSERIAAIDHYFSRHPERIGAVTFVQICGRTRIGLRQFDEYYDQCLAGADYLQERWSTADWQPLRWLHKSFAPAELSQLYRNADIMLVNPVRDGLNLTAKEYVACQREQAGVLLLSRGAGAFDELGDYALPASPAVSGEISDSIERALIMSQHEKNARMLMLKQKVEKNSLSRWWQKSQHAFALTESQAARHDRERIA